mmetsp:Transcript_80211/g.259917  ORF Transcript_80211/g.259917 Transcript_80211/m.259917 type:complete len:220 (-) Transcript_80211:1137-1796(-)
MSEAKTSTMTDKMKSRTGNASEASRKAFKIRKKSSKRRRSLSSLSTGTAQTSDNNTELLMESALMKTLEEKHLRPSTSMPTAMSTRLHPLKQKAIRLGQVRNRTTTSRAKIKSKTTSSIVTSDCWSGGGSMVCTTGMIALTMIMAEMAFMVKRPPLIESGSSKKDHTLMLRGRRFRTRRRAVPASRCRSALMPFKYSMESPRLPLELFRLGELPSDGCP